MKTILITCVDWDIGFSEFPDMTEAQKAMLAQMAHLGGIDPELLDSKSEYTSSNCSYCYSLSLEESWAWTTNNSKGGAECHWLIKVVNEQLCEVLLTEWQPNMLNAWCHITLAEAQRAMRSSMLNYCDYEDNAIIEENAAFLADNISFDAMSATLTKSVGTYAWKIYPLRSDPKAKERYLGTVGIKVKQTIEIPEQELNEINDFVSHYSPDMDSINYGRTLIPHQWEVDFGGGWTATIDVVDPITVKEHWDAYCEAVLYRNGEIVHRSIRDNHLDGVWGLRYDNYLFQVEVKEG